jgi:hypothetical protein
MQLTEFQENLFREPLSQPKLSIMKETSTIKKASHNMFIIMDSKLILLVRITFHHLKLSIRISISLIT